MEPDKAEDRIVYSIIYSINRLIAGDECRMVQEVAGHGAVPGRNDGAGFHEFGEIARGGGLGDLGHPRPLGGGEPRLRAGFAVLEHPEDDLAGALGEGGLVAFEIVALGGDEPRGGDESFEQLREDGDEEAGPGGPVERARGDVEFVVVGTAVAGDEGRDRQGDGMPEPFGENLRHEGAADTAVAVLEGVDRLEVDVQEGGLERDVGRRCGGVGIPDGDESRDLLPDAFRGRRLEARLGPSEAVHAHDAHGDLAERAGADAAVVALEKRAVPPAQERGGERGVPVLPHGEDHPGGALGAGVAGGRRRGAGDAERAADGGHHDGLVDLDPLDGARRDGLRGERARDEERILRFAQRRLRRAEGAGERGELVLERAAGEGERRPVLPLPVEEVPGHEVIGEWMRVNARRGRRRRSRPPRHAGLAC